MSGIFFHLKDTPNFTQSQENVQRNLHICAVIFLLENGVFCFIYAVLSIIKQ